MTNYFFKLIPKFYNLYYEPSDLLYCRIPKNACTTMRYTFIKNLDYFYRFPGTTDIEKLSNIEKNPQLLSAIGQVNKKKAKLKLLILRNPYYRIISAFLDRCCKNKDKLSEIINFELNLNKKLLDFNFNYFLENLTKTNFYRQNPHFIPQKTFMMNVKYNFVFNLDKFKEKNFINLFENKTKLKYYDARKIKDHSTQSFNHVNLPNANELTIRDLKKLINVKKIPKYDEFLNEKNKSIIQNVYHKDFNLFKEYQIDL